MRIIGRQRGQRDARAQSMGGWEDIKIKIFIDGKFPYCRYFWLPSFSNPSLREMLRPFWHSMMERYDY